MRINGNYGVVLNQATDSLTEDREIDKIDSIKNLQNNSVVKTELGDKPKDISLIDYKEVLQKPKEDSEVEESPTEEDVSNTSNRLTEKDYEDIDKEGISLEKYNLERLDRMLSRIKTQRTLKEEQLVNQMEKLEERTGDIREISLYYGADKELIKRMENSSIPITPANIAKLSNTWEMAKGAIDITEQSSAYMIKNGLKPTVENIYKAKYSATKNEKTEITDKEWDELKEQVGAVMQLSGMEQNQGNLENGRWLIENQLPVSAKSLWMMQDLDMIKQEITKDMVIERGIEAIASGYTPESASLSLVNSHRVTKVMSAFEAVTDNDIHAVLVKRENNPQVQINYTNLVEEQKHQLVNGQTKDKNANKHIYDPMDEVKDLDIKTITVRRQLEELRLRLTVESGSKLIKNGLSIETESISRIIDELKSLEESYYNNLLKEGNIEVSESNINIIKSNLLGMEELKSAPSYILGATISNRQDITVKGLLEVGRDYKTKLAESAYETLMTAPRSDLGDSIKKAFDNVEDILKDMNLDNNEVNARAVRILGYNNMEITNDSITRIKVYDSQVNHMLKNFHPAVAVEMIREGLNPLEMTVPQLNQQLDNIKEELGITEEERFSKFLWKMDKNKSISESERNTFIGIYRLLNSIAKTDGAALGAVVKADQEVTMKSLLTAIQSKKNKNMDYSIDNTFGALSQYIPRYEDVTSQINTAFSNISPQTESAPAYDTEKTDYIKHIVVDMKDDIQPDNLLKLGVNHLMESPIETIREELRSATETSSDLDYYKEQLLDLEDLVKMKAESTQVLKNMELPVTLANLFAAKDYLTKEDQLFTRLNKISKEKNNINHFTEEEDALNLTIISDTLLESLTDKESMVKNYEELKNNWSKSWDSMIPELPVTKSDIMLFKGISSGMSLITQMSYKESYEIPLKVGDNFTNVNVTILKNAGEAGKVNINMDSLELGNVSVGVTIKNKEANIFITSDSRLGYETLLREREQLKSLLNNQNLKIKQINYGMGNQTKDSNRYNYYNVNKQPANEEEKVDTKTLYSLAKTILVHVKEMELNKE